MPTVIPPLLLLALLLALTLMAWAGHALIEQRRIRALRELAGRWQMRFVREDLFQLGRRLGGQVPVPGAADVRVLDVIYGAEGSAHRYVFTLEYTLGAVGRHRREARAATFQDSSDPAADHAQDIKLADAGLPLVKQYESLHDGNTGGDGARV